MLAEEQVPVGAGGTCRPPEEGAVLPAGLDPPALISALKALDVTLQRGINDLQSSSSSSASSSPASASRDPAPVHAPCLSPVQEAPDITHEVVSEKELYARTLAGSGPRSGSGVGAASGRPPPGKVPTLPVNGAAVPVRRRRGYTPSHDFEPTKKVDETETKRQDMVTIYARVVFLKLGEIDTVAEKFNADAFIQARWREPNLDGQHTNTQFELCAKDIFWDPKLYVENAMGEPKESVWQIVSFNDRAEATIYQRRRVKGTFFERMELMQYPFDTQDLTLTITTERGEEEVDLQADESEVSSVNIQSFVDEQEWHLHKHINTWTRGMTSYQVTTNVYQNSKHKHPAVSISCKATRRSQFFIWNIILVMVFICSLVFATFSVNLGKPENRIQLTFILLLSNITFKFTVNQTLPKVSYLTYLDKYILSSMAILCLVCVWHAVVPLLAYDMVMARRADNCAFGVLAGLYVLFNVTFFTWSRCLVSRRWREYSKKDARQRERLTHMEEVASAAVNQVAPI